LKTLKSMKHYFEFDGERLGEVMLFVTTTWIMVHSIGQIGI